MSEFYLVSSLPALVFGAPPALTMNEFLRSAQGVLSEDHLQDLRLLLEGRSGEADSSEVQALHNQEIQIRNAVARHRASVMEGEAKAADRMHAGFRVWLENAVKQALSLDTPRQREKALDHVRWKAAAELMQADAYGFGFVAGYAVQLQIAQRWAGLSKDKGHTEVRFLVEHYSQKLKEWA